MAAQYLPREIYIPQDQLPGWQSQLRQTQTDEQRASILLQLGYGYLYKDGEHRSDLDSALVYAWLLSELSTRIHNETMVQQALLLRSMIHMEQKDFHAAERLFPAYQPIIPSR